MDLNKLLRKCVERRTAKAELVKALQLLCNDNQKNLLSGLSSKLQLLAAQVEEGCDYSSTEDVFDLVVAFVVSSPSRCNGEPLWVWLLALLFEWSSSTVTSVRSLSCKWLALLLGSLGDVDIEYAPTCLFSFSSADLADQVENALILRTKDKVGSVRAEALKALSTFQHPENEALFDIFVERMREDSIVYVTVLQLIAT